MSENSLKKILTDINELELSWHGVVRRLKFDEAQFLSSLAKPKTRIEDEQIDGFLDTMRRFELVAFFDEAIENGIVTEEELQKQSCEGSEGYFQRITKLLNSRLPNEQEVFYCCTEELSGPLDIIRIDHSPYSNNASRSSGVSKDSHFRQQTSFTKAGLAVLPNGEEVWFLSHVDIFNSGLLISEDNSYSYDGVFKFEKLDSRYIQDQTRTIQEDLSLAGFDREKAARSCTQTCCSKRICTNTELPNNLLAYIEVSVVGFAYCATLSLPRKVNVLNIPGSIVNTCADAITNRIESTPESDIVRFLISLSKKCTFCNELSFPELWRYNFPKSPDRQRNPILSEYLEIWSLHKSCGTVTPNVRNCNCGEAQSIVVNGVPYCSKCASNTVHS